MNTSFLFRLPVVFLAYTVTSTLSASAAVVVTTSGGLTPFPVSATDLLQTDLGSAPVVTGTFTAFGSSGEPVLRDGISGPSSAGDFPTTAIITTNSTVTYTFDVFSNPLGYEITQIDSFGAWDDGRDRQDISILFSTVSDPAAFTLLTSYSFDPPGATFSRVSVTPGVGDTFLMSNVHSIRFLFPDQENDGGGYRELDVQGFAIPEPSCLSLLSAVGFIAAFSRRRSVG
jgi:hypothetical protein